MVRAAHAHPRLRVLFPTVSHGSLQLSRCTRSPWTRDVPALFRRSGGGYTIVHFGHGGIIGEPDTIEEAIDLIVANLPPGCGPADDL
ncbi:DUF6193 family natural product biosynthesis protein [Streptomyces sp. HU2014]|uniref:DUF6193 family natural product biosynthesis protein n=1 Tax=Streptomyces sp. HU2014 TaxID=2939414 RepID=UPI0024B3AF8A|nr:DUF6193 family natural product biosynthesis protein [Streptomyces sp. HU2014]